MNPLFSLSQGVDVSLPGTSPPIKNPNNKLKSNTFSATKLNCSDPLILRTASINPEKRFYHTPKETREKIEDSLRGSTGSSKSKAKRKETWNRKWQREMLELGFTGETHTPETKNPKKKNLPFTGKTHTPETKNPQKKNPRFTGRNHTLETKEKIARILRGRTGSSESKAKRKETWRRKKLKCGNSNTPLNTSCMMGDGKKRQETETEAGVSQDEIPSSALLTGKNIYNYLLVEKWKSFEQGN